MTAAEFALRTDGVGKRYRKGWARRDCTLDLPAGGVITLVGPNGAGKTTLLHLAVGLLPPSTGTVEVLGHDVTAGTPHTLSRIRVPGSGPPAVQALHRRRDAPLRPGPQRAAGPTSGASPVPVDHQPCERAQVVERGRIRRHAVQ